MKPQPPASQGQPGAELGLFLGGWKRWAGLRLSWLVLLRPHALSGYWKLAWALSCPPNPQPIMSVSRLGTEGRCTFQPCGQSWTYLSSPRKGLQCGCWPGHSTFSANRDLSLPRVLGLRLGSAVVGRLLFLLFSIFFGPVGLTVW